MNTTRVDKTGIIEEVLADNDQTLQLRIADEREGITAVLNILRAEAGGSDSIGKFEKGMKVQFQLANGMHVENLQLQN